MYAVATIVTSFPGRTTVAEPMGTVCSPSGTGPLVPDRRLCRITNTGLSSRIAEVSSPFASAAVLGITTFRPGM